jgi:gentisate 1,2-dioxygenase
MKRAKSPARNSQAPVEALKQSKDDPLVRERMAVLETEAGMVESYFDTLEPPEKLEPLCFKWKDVAPLLDALAKSPVKESPRAGKIINFIGKATGELRGTTPVMLAGFQIVPPGFKGMAHRHTNTAIQYCVKGRGYSVIDGSRYDWETGDVLVFPPDCMHEHANLDEKEPAIFFHVHDLTLVRLMRLKKTVNLPEGYQKITRRA